MDLFAFATTAAYPKQFRGCLQQQAADLPQDPQPADSDTPPPPSSKPAPPSASSQPEEQDEAAETHQRAKLPSEELIAEAFTKLTNFSLKGSMAAGGPAAGK